MLYKKWKPFYKQILNDFNFEYKNDIESAKLLDNLLSEKNIFSIKELEKNIKGKKVAIFGAGSSLENSKYYLKNELKNSIKITADGATSFLLENKIIPDIIVTDLDGKISDQIQANKTKSLIVIHAHGDNFDKIKNYLPEFKGKIIGTTQTNPKDFKNLYNFGGFTDGDRAVFLADHFKAKKIYLLGFDYENKIGKYSFSDKKNRKIKLRKLKWCKKLISELQKQLPNIKYL